MSETTRYKVESSAEQAAGVCGQEYAGYEAARDEYESIDPRQCEANETIYLYLDIVDDETKHAMRTVELNRKWQDDDGKIHEREAAP